jgi:hypothetical protein
MGHFNQAWDQCDIGGDVREGGVWSLTTDHVAIGIAPHEARARESYEPFEHTDGVMSDGDQVTQHEESVDTALRLDIREHRVQSDGIAVQVRQDGQAHVLSNGATGARLRHRDPRGRGTETARLVQLFWHCAANSAAGEAWRQDPSDGWVAVDIRPIWVWQTPTCGGTCGVAAVGARAIWWGL